MSLRRIGLLAVLACLLVAVYRPLLVPGATTFVYEDEGTIQVNPMVLGLSPIPLHAPRWLTWTTYRIDAWRGGQTAQLHQTNLALAFLVGILVFAVATRWGYGDGALLAAGIVWVHPVTVESVGYLTGRSELILAIGVLVALLVTPRAGDRWTALRLLGVACGCLLAVGGKELGIVTPLLVCLVRPLPRWTWPLGWALAGVVLIWLVRQHSAVGLSPYPPLTAFALQATAAVHGLRLLVLPIGLSVDANIVGSGWLLRLWSVFLVLSAVPIGLVAWRRVPALGFALGWLAVSLGPRLVAQSWELLNEHQWYVPLIGIALACGSLWVESAPQELCWLGAGDPAW